MKTKIILGVLSVLLVGGGYTTYSMNQVKKAGEFETVGSLSNFNCGTLSSDPQGLKKQYESKLAKAKQEYNKAMSKAKDSKAKKNAKDKYNNTIKKLKSEYNNKKSGC